MSQYDVKNSHATYKGQSDTAANGLLNIQYQALKEAGNFLRQKMIEAVKSVPKGPKRKQNWSNVAVRTYTRTKYGFVVAQVGEKAAGKAKGEAENTARYDSSVGVGQNHYLTDVTQANIQEMRKIMGQYLPGLTNDDSANEQEDILDD